MKDLSKAILGRKRGGKSVMAQDLVLEHLLVNVTWHQRNTGGLSERNRQISRQRQNQGFDPKWF